VRDHELTAVVTATQPVPVVTCTGDLTVASGARLSRILSKVLLDTGRLMVDVDALAPASSARVALFPSVLARAGGWPDARMVLLAASRSTTARAMRFTGRVREVPVAPDRASGLAALDRRPEVVRRTTNLPGSVEAAGFARAMVGIAARDWELPSDVRDRAVAVVSELVTNAVEHTEGMGELTLTVSGGALRAGVRDGAAAPLPGPEAWGGGLRVVAGLSDAHGLTPHLDGKTVWALFRP
jgi:hypothetical protein